MPISLKVRVFRLMALGAILTAVALGQQKKISDPRPMAFSPAPSSLVLLLAGLAVLLAWNWWRGRVTRN
jgi:hypothetical protein